MQQLASAALDQRAPVGDLRRPRADHEDPRAAEIQGRSGFVSPVRLAEQAAQLLLQGLGLGAQAGALRLDRLHGVRPPRRAWPRRRGSAPRPRRGARSPWRAASRARPACRGRRAPPAWVPAPARARRASPQEREAAPRGAARARRVRPVPGASRGAGLDSSACSCAVSSSRALRRRMSARLDAPMRWDSMWTSPNARITRRLLATRMRQQRPVPAGNGARGERVLPLCFERALVSCRCEALDGGGVAPVQRLVQQFARPIAARGEPDAEAVQIVVRRGHDVEPLAASDPAQDLPQLALGETGADDRAVQCRVQLPQPFASRIGLIPKPRQIVQTGQRDRQRPSRRPGPEGQLARDRSTGSCRSPCSAASPCTPPRLAIFKSIYTERRPASGGGALAPDPPRNTLVDCDRGRGRGLVPVSARVASRRAVCKGDRDLSSLWLEAVPQLGVDVVRRRAVVIRARCGSCPWPN